MNTGAMIVGAIVGYFVWDYQRDKAASRRMQVTGPLIEGGGFIGPRWPEEADDFEIELEQAESYVHDARAMLESGDAAEARYYAVKAGESAEAALDAAYELGDKQRYARARTVLLDAVEVGADAVSAFWAEDSQ